MPLLITVASLWIGDELGPLETASIRSFLDTGHRYILYSYGKVRNVPPGVQRRDAKEVFPTTSIITVRKNGHSSLHADLFRYRMMEKTGLLWVDLDVIALREFRFSLPMVFGYESDLIVNNAVLYLPPTSKTLQSLLRYHIDFVGLPAHLKGFRRLRYWIKSWGRGLPIDRWPWGSLGPQGLTHYLGLHGELRHALPISAFYSVPLQEVWKFAEPGALAISDLPKDAYAVHLWGSALKRYIELKYQGRIPNGSFAGSF